MFKKKSLITKGYKSKKIKEAISYYGKNDDYFYYYHLLKRIKIYETDVIETAAAIFDRKNRTPVIVYNPEFVEQFNEKQNCFLLTHEIMHIIFKHNEIKNYAHNVANMGTDFVINTIIQNEFKHFEKLPMGLYFESLDNQKYKVEINETTKGVDYGIYDDKLNSIHVIEWLLQNEDLMEKMQQQQQQQQGGGEGEEGEGDPQQGNGGFGKGFDEHLNPEEDGGELDQLSEGTNHQGNFIPLSELNENEQNSIKNMVEDAIAQAKSAGKFPSNIENTIELLREKPKKDVFRQLKTLKSSLAARKPKRTFTKLPIFSRPGAKGYKFEGKMFNIILDTSGSMFGGDLEKVLQYLFIRGNVYNIIQVDTEVKCDNTKPVTLKDFKKYFEVKGGGGTNLNPAIDYINEDKKMAECATVILTDGYLFDDLNTRILKGDVFIVSSGQSTPHNGGKVKEYVIPNND